MVGEERIVSRHNSSEGVVTYVRRRDGGLQVWLERREPTAREMMGESSHRGGAGRGPASADPAPGRGPE